MQSLIVLYVLYLVNPEHISRCGLESTIDVADISSTKRTSQTDSFRDFHERIFYKSELFVSNLFLIKRMFQICTQRSDRSAGHLAI